MGGNGMSFALVADAEGKFPTPFPYLNPYHPFWLGSDGEQGGEDGLGDTGGNVALLDPDDEGNDGGDEADPEEDDDDMDDGDGFFGVGHWFPKILVSPPQFMPA